MVINAIVHTLVMVCVVKRVGFEFVSIYLFLLNVHVHVVPSGSFGTSFSSFEMG